MLILFFILGGIGIAAAIYGYVNLTGSVAEAAAIRMAKGIVDEGTLEAVLEHANHDPDGAKLAQERAGVMSGVFPDWKIGSKADLETLKNTCLVDLNLDGRMLGFVKIEHGEYLVRIYDWFQGLPSTVVVVTPPPMTTLKVDAPEFYLHPALMNVATHYELVGELNLPGYVLESPSVAYQTRQLFEVDREMNDSRLFNFVRDRCWTVDWSGTGMLAFRHMRLADPNQVLQQIADTIALTELAIDTAKRLTGYLDLRVSAAAANLTTPSPPISA